MSKQAAAPNEEEQSAPVMLNHHMDTRHWSRITMRPDDVLIGTYGRSGTTWMQNIVAKVVGIPPSVRVEDASPWVELRFLTTEHFDALDAQNHRRFLKHHLARHYLPNHVLNETAQIYVARDGRDMMLSFYNFHSSFTSETLMALNSNLPDGADPIPTVEQHTDFAAYFEHWLDNNFKPWWPFWEHIRSWWEARHQSNVLLIHFSDLKACLEGEIARIHAFLGKHGEVISGEPDEIGTRIAQETNFDAMKKNAAKISPWASNALKNGSDGHIYKGTNNRWKSLISHELSNRYEQIAVEQLGEECASWLANGSTSH